MAGEQHPLFTGIDSGTLGRLRPESFIAPEGDWVVCLGHETKLILPLGHGDKFEIEQTADFDDTTVFRFRARIRFPDVIPTLVRVDPVATGNYTITINGVDHTYAADTVGLLIGSGAAASIDATNGDRATIGGLVNMTAASVGRRLVISGAASAGNNGTFAIVEFIDSTTVRVRNPGAVSPDANDGSISWEERRRPDNDTTIALALRDLLNAGDEPVVARVTMSEGLLQVERGDKDIPFVIAVVGNLTVATFSWITRMLINGTVRWSETIDPDRRARDVIDAGAEIAQSVGAGNVPLRFEIELVSSLSAGRLECEVPGVCFDNLSFDTVT